MAKGHKTGGRVKGTPNKISKDLRAAIMEAFDELGGVEYLVRIANSKEAGSFIGLLGKVLPKEITGAEGGPVSVKILRFTDA